MNYQPPSDYNPQAASWQGGVEPTPYAPPAYSSAGTYPAYNVSAPSDRNRGSAMAGLILGLISLLLPAIVYFVLSVSTLAVIFSILAVLCLFFGFPISIVGLIFSIRGRRSLSRKGMATAGLVLSIIGLLLALGYIILVVLVASRP